MKCCAAVALTSSSSRQIRAAREFAAELRRWVSQMRLWLSVALWPTLSGCSAMILAVGEPEERSIIHSGSKRTEVSAFLGEPISSTTLTPELEANALLKQDKGIEPLSDERATAVATYRYTGWVQKNTDVGEAAALAGYTLFLSELVMIPLAIKEQTERSGRTHIVNVWYDANDHVVAYRWASEE